MLKNYTIFLLIFLRMLPKLHGQTVPNSPCPNIFRYSYDRSKWSGIAEIITPPLTAGQPIKLIVFLSLKTTISTDYVGSVELLDTRQETFANIYQNRPVRYQILFPSSAMPLPKVTRIILNNWVICSGQPETGFYVTEIRLEHTLYAPPSLQNHIPQEKESDINSLSTDKEDEEKFLVDNESDMIHGQESVQQSIFRPWQIIPTPRRPDFVQPFIYPESTTGFIQETTVNNRQSDEEICGRPFFQLAHFLNGGQNIVHGSWPWLVAIFLNRPAGPEYLCGGSLVSSKVIVTAAHCLSLNDRKRRANEIVVTIGRYINVRWGRPKNIDKIESIILHNDYSPEAEKFDADIAILIVKTRVQYSKFVRPICLWENESKGNGNGNIDPIEGTVAIWSKDGNDNYASVKPELVDIPILNNEECVKQSQTHSYETSNRTFCAGLQEGRGPCYGDSGNGMAVRQNKKWFLRGIVSGGLNDPACATSNYVVFTDTAKFISFIKPYMLL